MPAALEVCKWLEQSLVGTRVRQSLWLFPAIETVHLLGMAALLATIGAFDLRLMGMAFRGERISVVGRRLLPWAMAGFSLQVLTGGLLFSSEAAHMVANPAFRVKMLLIVLAGAHALVFPIVSRRNPRWDDPTQSPLTPKIAGATSLLLWIGVVAAGRWIGFI